MPVISRFHGLVVFMNYNDHEPPHIRARYQDGETTVEIETGRVVGELSPRALRMLVEWVDLHREELEVNWRRVCEHRHLLPVEPLP